MVGPSLIRRDRSVEREDDKYSLVEQSIHQEEEKTLRCRRRQSVSQKDSAEFVL